MLAWRLSNALTTDFCLDAVEKAITQDGSPKIFNTDLGCQFTSHEFTGLLTHHGIPISMDSTGCWRDNVSVEYPGNASHTRSCIRMPTKRWELCLGAAASSSIRQAPLIELKDSVQTSGATTLPNGRHPGSSVTVCVALGVRTQDIILLLTNII